MSLEKLCFIILLFYIAFYFIINIFPLLQIFLLFSYILYQNNLFSINKKINLLSSFSFIFLLYVWEGGRICMYIYI